MEGPVEGRPDQAVHAGVTDHKGLGSPLLDVLNTGHQDSCELAMMERPGSIKNL